MGIWWELFRFKHVCLANCTYIHIHGALAVFTLRHIERGESLSIDFLNWQTKNRALMMKEKLGRTCSCSFCEWQNYDFNDSVDLLYEFYRQESVTWIQAGYYKICLFFLWEMIYFKRYRQVQLLLEYLLLLQKYPLWQCTLNCLKYLRTRPKNDVFDHIKSSIKKLFQKYFNLSHSQAVELLKNIL